MSLEHLNGNPLLCVSERAMVEDGEEGRVANSTLFSEKGRVNA